jgi:hypothetical protein
MSAYKAELGYPIGAYVTFTYRKGDVWKGYEGTVVEPPPHNTHQLCIRRPDQRFGSFNPEMIADLTIMRPKTPAGWDYV